MSSFDLLRFLRDHFRDPDGVVGLLGSQCGRAPNKEAVRKWFSREAVSADWWPLLLVALEKQRGTPVALGGYYREDEGDSYDIFA